MGPSQQVRHSAMGVSPHDCALLTVPLWLVLSARCLIALLHNLNGWHTRVQGLKGNSWLQWLAEVMPTSVPTRVFANHFDTLAEVDIVEMWACKC